MPAIYLISKSVLIRTGLLLVEETCISSLCGFQLFLFFHSPSVHNPCNSLLPPWSSVVWVLCTTQRKKYRHYQWPSSWLSVCFWFSASWDPCRMCICPSTAWTPPGPSFHYYLGPSMFYLVADSAFALCFSWTCTCRTLLPRKVTGDPCTWDLAFLSPNLWRMKERSLISQPTLSIIFRTFSQPCLLQINIFPVWNQSPTFLGTVHCKATIVHRTPDSLPCVRPFLVSTVNSTRRFFLPTYCLSNTSPAFCCPLGKSKQEVVFLFEQLRALESVHSIHPTLCDPS